MWYALISASALLFSLQFLFTDTFRHENGNTWVSSLKFSLYTSISGFIVLLIFNKFHFDISIFSFLVALVFAAINISMVFCSLKAFEHANLSVYSVFCMIGGMTLPFIYGAFSGEEITISKIVCFIFIALSVLLSVNPGKHSKKASLYYFAVFIFNGLVGVISTLHQSVSELNVDSSSFVILTKITTIGLTLPLLLFTKTRSFRINFKSIMYCIGYSLFNTVGNLWLLIALTYLPASVQYPMVTGGTIVFSAIISVLRKEKPRTREIFSCAIALIASVCMAF